jgi:hypothetical protein
MHETMSLFQDLLIWPSVAGARRRRRRRRTWPFISLSLLHQRRVLSDDFSRTLSESLGALCDAALLLAALLLCVSALE